MFRANRIGHPVIHQQSNTTNTTNTWAAGTLNTAAFSAANVVNASPLLDFGQSRLHWNATQSLAAATKYGITQQFTITQPLNGDTVGVELCGSIIVDASLNVLLIPFFARTTGAAATVLGVVNFLDQPTFFDCDKQNNDISTRLAQTMFYKEELIIQASSIGATYVHGFAIMNTTAGAIPITYMDVQFSERQLNDQQSIGYRDTRR